jgi:hypothetical protein
MTTEMSIPKPVLAALEVELTKVPYPYALVYDDDDDETCAVLQRFPRPWESYGHVMEMCLCSVVNLLGAATLDVAGIHGWIPELSCLEKFRKQEDGG